MGNLKDIQDITSLTSEAIFNIRKPVDYMCSDIDSHIKDIRTQCDYIMDGDEEDVKYYSKSIKSDVDSYFEDIRSKVENLRDWGEQWKVLAKDLFDELMKVNSNKAINSYLSYEALERLRNILKINRYEQITIFDLETTGVKFWRNGIHQIGGIVDIDGQEVERFDIRLAPNPAATIEQEALDVAGVTLEQVQSYQPMEDGYRQLVGILSKYVNKFDKRDKMYLVGYNNAGFDNSFLRALFQQCGDKYFGSWFYPNCMDVYVMVTPFLMGVRNDMENFKLMTVAKTMGIEIDENKLHDATYDIELTRDIFYRIIGKMDVKL